MFVLVGKVSKYLFVGVGFCMFMVLPNDVEPKALTVLLLCLKTMNTLDFGRAKSQKF